MNTYEMIGLGRVTHDSAQLVIHRHKIKQALGSLTPPRADDAVRVVCVSAGMTPQNLTIDNIQAASAGDDFVVTLQGLPPNQGFQLVVQFEEPQGSGTYVNLSPPLADHTPPAPTFMQMHGQKVVFGVVAALVVIAVLLLSPWGCGGKKDSTGTGGTTNAQLPGLNGQTNGTNATVTITEDGGTTTVSKVAIITNTPKAPTPTPTVIPQESGTNLSLAEAKKLLGKGASRATSSSDVPTVTSRDLKIIESGTRGAKQVVIIAGDNSGTVTQNGSGGSGNSSAEVEDIKERFDIAVLYPREIEPDTLVIPANQAGGLWIAPGRNVDFKVDGDHKVFPVVFEMPAGWRLFKFVNPNSVPVTVRFTNWRTMSVNASSTVPVRDSLGCPYTPQIPAQN